MPVESLYGPLSKLESTKLWKKSLQQFHQYQQNKQSPLILTHSYTKKKGPWHMMLEIQDLAWDKCKNVARLNQFIGYKPLSW